MTKICLLLISLFNLSALGGIPLSERPKEVAEKITTIHQELISESTKKKWQYSGLKTYGLMALDDEKLIDFLVRKKQEKNQTIRIMDFGSGDFQWPVAIAQYVRKHYEKSGLKFEIVGVTGEIAYAKEDLEKIILDNSSENIKTRLLQQIEIESISNFFSQEEKFDLIVSRWTILHLVDPFGSIYQLYNRLHKGGLFLFDGFPFHFGSGHFNINNNFALTLSAILFRSNATFLTRNYSESRSMNQFLLMKSSEDNLLLPVQYADSRDFVETDSRFGSGLSARYENVRSNFGNRGNLSSLKKYNIRYTYTTTYNFPEEGIFNENIDSERSEVFLGDKELLDAFINENLLENQKNEVFVTETNVFQ